MATPHKILKHIHEFSGLDTFNSDYARSSTHASKLENLYISDQNSIVTRPGYMDISNTERFGAGLAFYKNKGNLELISASMVGIYSSYYLDKELLEIYETRLGTNTYYANRPHLLLAGDIDALNEEGIKLSIARSVKLKVSLPKTILSGITKKSATTHVITVPSGSTDDLLGELIGTCKIAIESYNDGSQVIQADAHVIQVAANGSDYDLTLDKTVTAPTAPFTVKLAAQLIESSDGTTSKGVLSNKQFDSGSSTSQYLSYVIDKIDDIDRASATAADGTVSGTYATALAYFKETLNHLDLDINNSFSASPSYGNIEAYTEHSELNFYQLIDRTYTNQSAGNYTNYDAPGAETWTEGVGITVVTSGTSDLFGYSLGGSGRVLHVGNTTGKNVPYKYEAKMKFSTDNNLDHGTFLFTSHNANSGQSGIHGYFLTGAEGYISKLGDIYYFNYKVWISGRSFFRTQWDVTSIIKSNNLNTWEFEVNPTMTEIPDHTVSGGDLDDEYAVGVGHCMTYEDGVYSHDYDIDKVTCAYNGGSWTYYTSDPLNGGVEVNVNDASNDNYDAIPVLKINEEVVDVVSSEIHYVSNGFDGHNNGTCSVPGNSTQTDCELPQCSIPGYFSEAACTTGYCDDPTYTDQTTCETAGNTWTAGAGGTWGPGTWTPVSTTIPASVNSNRLTRNLHWFGSTSNRTSFVGHVEYLKFYADNELISHLTPGTGKAIEEHVFTASNLDFTYISYNTITGSSTYEQHLGSLLNNGGDYWSYRFFVGSFADGGNNPNVDAYIDIGKCHDFKVGDVISGTSPSIGGVQIYKISPTDTTGKSGNITITDVEHIYDGTYGVWRTILTVDKACETLIVDDTVSWADDINVVRTLDAAADDAFSTTSSGSNTLTTTSTNIFHDQTYNQNHGGLHGGNDTYIYRRLSKPLITKEIIHKPYLDKHKSAFISWASLGSREWDQSSSYVQGYTDLLNHRNVTSTSENASMKNLQNCVYIAGADNRGLLKYDGQSIYLAGLHSSWDGGIYDKTYIEPPLPNNPGVRTTSNTKKPKRFLSDVVSSVTGDNNASAFRYLYRKVHVDNQGNMHEGTPSSQHLEDFDTGAYRVNLNVEYDDTSSGNGNFIEKLEVNVPLAYEGDERGSFIVSGGTNKIYTRHTSMPLTTHLTEEELNTFKSYDVVCQINVGDNIFLYNHNPSGNGFCDEGIGTHLTKSDCDLGHADHSGIEGDPSATPSTYVTHWVNSSQQFKVISKELSSDDNEYEILLEPLEGEPDYSYSSTLATSALRLANAAYKKDYRYWTSASNHRLLIYRTKNIWFPDVQQHIADPTYYLVDEIALPANYYKGHEVNITAVSNYITNYIKYPDVAHDNKLEASERFLVPDKIPGTPPKGKYIETYNTSLLISGVEEEPNTIYYSDFDSPCNFPQAANGFNASGEVTGLGTIGNSLYIFQSDKIQVMEGDLILDNFVVNTIATEFEIGAVSHSAITEVNGALYFVTKKGIFALKDNKIIEVSKLIRPDFDKEEYDFDKATSINWTKKHQYLVYLPKITKSSTADTSKLSGKDAESTDGVILAFDYSKNAWCVWKGILSGGGFAELDGDVYFSYRREVDSAKSILAKFIDSEYADQRSHAWSKQSITWSYETNWEALGDYTTPKKFLRLKLLTDDSTNTEAAISTTLKIYKDFQSTSKDLAVSVASTSFQKIIKLPRGHSKSLKIGLTGNGYTHFKGFEVEAVAPYKSGEMKE